MSKISVLLKYVQSYSFEIDYRKENFKSRPEEEIFFLLLLQCFVDLWEEEFLLYHIMF